MCDKQPPQDNLQKENEREKLAGSLLTTLIDEHEAIMATEDESTKDNIRENLLRLVKEIGDDFFQGPYAQAARDIVLGGIHMMKEGRHDFTATAFRMLDSIAEKRNEEWRESMLKNHQRNLDIWLAEE